MAPWPFRPPRPGARACLVRDRGRAPARSERDPLHRGEADPTGLAALIIGSVPLWIVLLRTVAGDRPPRAVLAGVAVGFVGVALLVRPSGGAPLWSLLIVVCSALMWATGLPSRADCPSRATRSWPRRTRCSRGFDPPADRARDHASTSCARLRAFDPRAGLPRHHRVGRGLHGVCVAARQRAARNRVDVRIREPGCRNRARRDRAARVADLDDRSRRGPRARVRRGGRARGVSARWQRRPGASSHEREPLARDGSSRARPATPASSTRLRARPAGSSRRSPSRARTCSTPIRSATYSM